MPKCVLLQGVIMPPTPLFAYSIEWISVCESALQTQRDNRTCTHTVRTITIHTAKVCLKQSKFCYPHTVKQIYASGGLGNNPNDLFLRNYIDILLLACI